jgi:CheY-like chemotaxis protein
MTAKRALVVDDSKSARSFLAKLLEEQSLEVDSAETAEQAIDYLAQHRPDVIFMDHLMPGMDGFQAVQAIKGNPRTATIPILMYTSQEGELYLGQARALGAVGVLPKSVAPADVRTVLQQLHLVDQTEAATVAAQPELQEAAAVANTVETETLRPPVEFDFEGLRGELAAVKRQMFDHLEVLGQRFSAELRAGIRDALPQPEPPANEPPRSNAMPWMLAATAGLAAVVLGTLWWQSGQREQSLRNDLADARATVTELSARLVPVSSLPGGGVYTAADATPAVGAATPIAVKVPFGEAPLAGVRIDKLREFTARVIAEGARGTVEVRRYPGRFCLSGNATDGYSLAEAATPYLKCELVADANDPALGSATLESVAFATALAELRKQGGEGVHIDVQEGRGDHTAVAYPEIGGTPPRIPTAGEWNAAAEANNRVEIRWHPAP